MPKDTTWILSKCDAYREGWRRNFAALPSHENTALGVSVAIHETNAGEAWKGKNWGATTLRSLNAAEQWALATHALKLLIDAKMSIRGDRLGFNNFRYSWQRLQSGDAFDVVAMQKDLGLVPDGMYGSKSKVELEAWRAEYPDLTPAMVWPMVRERLGLTTEEMAVIESVRPTVGAGHEARAKEACRVLQEAFSGTGVALPKAEIHCDSTPKDGPYFVWFAAFDNHEDAATYFVRLLAGKPEKPKPAKAVLLKPGTPYELAVAMKSANYYTGFFRDEEIYPDGKTGWAKNVEAYAGRINASYPLVLSTLKTHRGVDHDTEPMIANMLATDNDSEQKR